MLTVDSKQRLDSFVFGTDGSGADQLIIRTGGARSKRTLQSTEAKYDDFSNLRCDDRLYMNGQKIFHFTLSVVPDLVREMLGVAHLKLEDIDHFVFHQANAFMLESLRKKIGIPEEKFVLYLENCGNTVSSTIPIALEFCLQTERIKAGERVLLAGFGVGFSWAGCILQWNGS